ncbi:MAG: MerR family transcriptional regulator [Actinomycetota bacterium]|nr:MerR family transcriptional regulator [Actinomycetota bacterium]
MEDRAYLSIGEVLSLLKEEFPDVTISKIRFLESQGLLDPERTPSGYRKFYESDVDRLRWILRQQRENFLPLKVIKGRLRDAAGEPLEDDGAVAAPLTRPSGSPTPPPAPAEAPSVVAPRSGTSLTLSELANTTGLEEDEVRELERFGLLAPRRVGTNAYYDDDAVLVANLAANFMRYGVEARHLRMYKVAAEREAAFFEQVVMPMLKQRNPQARRQATETLSELSRLGHGLRTAMLRQALRQYLEGQ